MTSRQGAEAFVAVLVLGGNALILSLARSSLRIDGIAQRAALGSILLVLIVLAVFGWWDSWKASRWAEAQLVQPVEGTMVLAQRTRLLERMGGSALAEGDLGRFLLRRESVPGEGAAAFMANLLVSIALLSTVVGLCVVLALLSQSLSNLSLTESSDIFKAVRKPLGYFPQLFLPTGEGLLLAVLLTWRQRLVDHQLERVWQRIDLRTELELLPQFLKPRESEVGSLERLALASQTMAGAATQFKEAGEQIAQVIPQLHAAVSKLDQFDTKLLADKLDKTADSFVQLVSQSREALADPAEKIALATTAMGAAAERVSAQLLALAEQHRDGQALTEQLARATGQMGSGMVALDDKLEKLGELETTLTSLNQAVLRLDGSFAGHSKDYLTTIVEIRSIVTSLRESMEPLLVNVDRVQTHGDQTTRELERFTQAFRAQSEEFNTTLKAYPEQLKQAFDQHITQTGNEHQTFMAELSQYFTQGPELFQSLDNLGQRLDAFATRVSSVDERMVDLGEMAKQLQGLPVALEHVATLGQNQQSELTQSMRELKADLQRAPQTGWRRFFR